MAGAEGAPLWSVARTAEGREYYYNVETKQTQWTKPTELLSPQERALAAQPWKSFKTPEGKEYFYNAETKETIWDMPEVYKNAIAQAQTAIPAKPPAPVDAFVAGGSSHIMHYPEQRDTGRGRDRDRDDYDRRDRGSDRRNDYGQGDSMRGSFVAATVNDPTYATYEEAEAAFFKLLKRANVQADWSWEQTMRATITDPQFRALNDPKDRRAAFEKFIVDLRAQDKEKEKERLAKLRQDFTTMLKSHPEIKHYTRWKTARPIIEGETIFRTASDDTERRQLFEEYVVSLKKAHAEHEAAMRKQALYELGVHLQQLVLEPTKKWSAVSHAMESHHLFQEDAKFKTLTKSDVLITFEDHIRALERQINNARQDEKSGKERRERVNRDKYVELLTELQSAGRLKAGAKWMDIHPLIEDDPRYVAMLGQTGSTPLDLFWDVVEEMERALRGKRNVVLDVLDDKQFEITPATTELEFMDVMIHDGRTSHIGHDDLTLLFARLHEKVVKRTEEDKHHAERQQRRAVDALRSRIKRLEPPVRANDNWERDVKPRVEGSEEYRAVESDELRRSAFDKHMRRVKDKEVEIEQERSRRDRDRDRDRERERDRDGRSNGHRRLDRYSRTPEVDAYEADRRKAVADRERNYRKASASGLSPPPPIHEPRRRDVRDRFDDRDRDRDRERDSARDRHDRFRPGPSPPYDRERRERGLDRERAYVSRADPREGVAKELDYGESGRAGSMAESNGTGRRRRGSNESEVKRDSKRLKTDATSNSPPAADAMEVELKSGSEDGEIEEVEVTVS